MKNKLPQRAIIFSSAIIAVLLLTVLLFTGCPGPLGKGGAASETGTVTVAVSGAYTRTALPRTTFARYSLSFAAEGKEPVTRTLTGDTVLAVELEPGTWTITAKGYVKINGEYYEAALGQKTLNVESGEEYSVSIVLDSPSGGDPGTFSYSVDLPSTVTVTAAHLKLAPLEDTGAVHDFDLLGDSESNPLTLDLAAGYYLMTITLTAGSMSTGKTEVIHIYSNMETRINAVFTEQDLVEQVISLEGKILILQAYGSGSENTDRAVSRSFVELYNNTDNSVSLDNCSLQYSVGGTVWEKLDLSGKTIPAHASFLILGKEPDTVPSPRLVLADTDADVIWEDMLFSNRNFKIAFIQNEETLTTANPFDIDDAGTKATGYIDMAGLKNSNSDAIDGFETEAPTVISKQKAARRKNLTDSNNNKTDFESIDYRESGTTDDECDFYRPKNSLQGSWDPVYEAPAVVEKLLILQAYGSGASTDGAVSHSFIELYNNTGAAVNLNGYSVQYSEGGTVWQKLDLSGKTIPAHASFLILGKAQNVGSRFILADAEADIIWTDMTFNNHNFKICLIESSSTLTIVNPFDTDSAGTKADGYVDMIGAINDSKGDFIDGFETSAPEIISKQKAARRKNLTDTDNNQYDFESIDYRTSGISESDLAKYRPQNSAFGNWNPAQ
jgi:hypothetical protein